MRAPSLLALLPLAACVAPDTPRPAAAARKPLSASAAPSGSATGALIGRTAVELTGMFGKPVQEAYELDARRLQWSGGRCVLDAYLSRTDGRGERRAIYADARTPAGEPVDAEACAASLAVRR